MRRAFSGFLIATSTFLIGLRTNEMIYAAASTPAFAYTVFAAVLPRFTPTRRGCGLGYFQDYETNHGETVSEGVTVFDSRREARQFLEKKQREAVRIVERKANAFDIDGDSGLRLILEDPSDEAGKTSCSIIWYDGGQFVRQIEAPTPDLALEFEQYLIGTKFRSPF